MHINRKWCKAFLWAVGGAFAAGVVLYCLIGSAVHQFFVSFTHTGAQLQSRPLWWAILLSGWVLAGLVGGAFLFSLWVARRSAVLKVLCAVFFPVTVLSVAITGIFGVFPTAAHCISHLQKRKFKKPPPLPACAQRRGKQVLRGYFPEGCAPPQNGAGRRYSAHMSTPPTPPANNKP